MVKKIENYTLLQCIGKGSSGEVYRATHAYQQGIYAIKVIQNQLLIDNPKAQQCLINEVKVLSKIGKCQNIVTFYELIKTKNNHYFVYEYCNGGNLYEKLKKNRKIVQSQAIKYVKDILSAYKILNKYKVMHRDLKPQNILFHNQTLKLADFGLCKGFQAQENMTKTMLGSPIYMAPQVLKGQSYTSKADIWSLGVILFQMLYGYCPYHSNSIATLASKIQTSPLQFPENPIVSMTAKQLLKKMLTKDHFRRIGWIQLFNQLIPVEDGESVSSRSIDIQKNNNSKSKVKSQKNSLCEIQGGGTSILGSPLRQIKIENKTPQKQTKNRFNSAKYLTYLSRSQEPSVNKHVSPPANIKKYSQFSQVNDNYNLTLFKKDGEKQQNYKHIGIPRIAAHNIPNNYNNYSNYKIGSYQIQPQINSKKSVQIPNNILSNIVNSISASNFYPHQHHKSIDFSSAINKNKHTITKTSLFFENTYVEKQMKQFIYQLQKLHAEFVKISPYCQTLLKTKNKDNINDIYQFLMSLRIKLLNFSKEFEKLKKQSHKDHQDLQTMIKYEIIGIEHTLEQICAFTGQKYNFTNTIGKRQWNSKNQYKYKNLYIEKSNAKINQISV